MVHVAREMERAGLHAAAADRRRHHQQGAHRGEDRARLQPGPVVHVLDASRAVACRRRSSRAPSEREAFVAENRARAGEAPARARQQAARASRCSPLEEARRRRRRDRLGDDGHPAGRRSPACARSSDVSLAEIVPFIDWSPFFHTWELRGRLPADLRGPAGGRGGARALRRRAETARADRRRGQLLDRARGLRLLPRERVGRRHRGLRRRDRARAPSRDFPHPAPADRARPRASRTRRLADFVAPSDSGPARPHRRLRGHGGHRRRRARADASRREHDDYNAIMVKALADRLAEAFAERLHQRAREDWGYGRGEALTQRGADPRAVPRHPPGAGLPGLPRPHREAHALRPARAERSTGIRLTESFAMRPRRERERPLLRAPAGALLRVGQDRRATRCSTTTRARAWTCARSSAGWPQPRLRPGGVGQTGAQNALPGRIPRPHLRAGGRG